MASCQGSSNTYTLKLNVSQSSQSIPENYSTLSWYLDFSCGSQYYQNSGTKDSFKVVINGSTLYNQSKVISFSGSNKSIRVASGSTKVYHNSDGKKSISFSCSFTPGRSASYYPSSISASGSMSLTTIPRASTFGTITGNTIGSSLTVNINRASSSFTHSLWCDFGGLTWQSIGSGISTSKAWMIPTTYANQVPNATSGTLLLRLRTYNGSTQIGSDVTKAITIVVPSSYVPAFSNISVARIDNGVPTAWGIYVKGYSKAKVTINGAVGSYGSTIKSYSISITGGLNSSINGAMLGPLNTHSTNTITCRITDSRGRTATKFTTISVYDYHQPKLSFTAVRCNVDGTENKVGKYCKITPIYSITELNAKNTVVSKSFKVEGTSFENTTCASGSSCVLGNNEITLDTQYNIVCSIVDGLNNRIIIETILNVASIPFNIPNTKKGISIGAYYNDDMAGALQVYGDSILDGNLKIEGTMLPKLAGQGSIGSTTDPFDTIYVDNWLRAKGASGLYFQDFGGGFHMQDTEWIRTYGSKKLYCNNEMRATSFNIAGTGVHVVARGENANGTYTRFYDGTQICIGEVTITPKTNTITSKVWTYPASFSASGTKLVVTASPVTGVPYTNVKGCSISNATTTSATAYVYRTNTTNTIVRIVAVGRWK